MILLSKPIPMKKVYVIFPREYSDDVGSLLHEAGVIHVVQIEQAKVLEEYEDYLKIREEIMNMITKVKGIRVEAELRAFEAAAITVEKVKSDIFSLSNKVSEIESKISELREEYEKLLLFNKVLQVLPSDLNPRSFHYKGKRISSILIVCKLENADNLKKSPYVRAFNEYHVDEETRALIIILESETFEKLLDYARSQGAQYPTGLFLKYLNEVKDLEELKRIISSEIVKVSENIKLQESQLEKIIKENAWLLGKYLLFVENMLQKYSALASLRELKHLTVLTGWIPLIHVNVLKSKLTERSVPMYIEFKDPEPGDNPPTLMSNPPIIKFYQLVTRLYGIPGYFEKDPTPAIAYSFALFFGLMNADLGYALLGVLAALFLLDKFVDDPKSPLFKEFKGVVLASNTVALIFGLLSGSVFGDFIQRFLGLQLPVLFSSILNPLDFIKFSLIIGLIHVNIAHVLTTIKLVKERKKGDLLIELGLFIVEVFGIPYILLIFFNYTIPFLGTIPPEILLAGSMCGILLIIAGSLITMRFLGVIMWLFQITGLLGDVLSYVRLAGVGLATYYMALIFNFIIEFASGALIQVSPVLSYAAVIPLAVLAHLMVTVLAQLGAFVHSLRLCILEFLTKFYEGNGYEYNPLRVINRTVLVLR